MSKESNTRKALEAGSIVLTVSLGVQHLRIEQLEEENQALKKQLVDAAAKVDELAAKVAKAAKDSAALELRICALENGEEKS